jgi:hypothetical protein
LKSEALEGDRFREGNGEEHFPGVVADIDTAFEVHFAVLGLCGEQRAIPLIATSRASDRLSASAPSASSAEPWELWICRKKRAMAAERIEGRSVQFARFL